MIAVDVVVTVVAVSVFGIVLVTVVKMVEENVKYVGTGAITVTGL